MTEGDTKTAPCTWGCGKTITHVWRRYPVSAGLPGFYWDGSACDCINGLIRGGTTQYRMGRRSVSTRQAA